MPIQKLYAFVEESGQDTEGRIFVVTVVISDETYQLLESACEEYERQSKKGRRKWHGANSQPRLEFMRLVISDSQFQGTLCYSKLQNQAKPDYDRQTVLSLASAIRSKTAGEKFVVEVWIDGLTQTKRTEYAATLRQEGLMNIHLHRVRKEESNTLIRLSDSLAGLLRDAIEAKYPEAIQLVNRGVKNGVIVEI